MERAGGPRVLIYDWYQGDNSLDVILGLSQGSNHVNKIKTLQILGTRPKMTSVRIA